MYSHVYPLAVIVRKVFFQRPLKITVRMRNAVKTLFLHRSVEALHMRVVV